MKIYTDLKSFTGITCPVLTVGTFDGVHLGHKKIINHLCEIAKQCNGQTTLLTFYPHPQMVIFPDTNNLKLITTQREKIKLLEEAGIQNLIILPFDKKFSRLSSTEYVRDILVNGIGVKKLVIGYDHQFGRNRTGGLKELKEFAFTYNFSIEEIKVKDVDDIHVSSTKIRKALEQGYISVAKKLLGHSFELSGMVVEGKHIGNEIGFPTANIHVSDLHKIIPMRGVYAVTIKHNEMLYKGMINIGTRPTVNQNDETVVEVHIFNFFKDIYNEFLSIDFVDFLRKEKKFDNIEELRLQLEKDKLQVLNLKD